MYPSQYKHKSKVKFQVLATKHGVYRKSYRLIEWPSGLRRIQVLSGSYWRNTSDFAFDLPGAGEIALTV